jgi:uncharacterized protein YecT (DUF1311 family)
VAMPKSAGDQWIGAGEFSEPRALPAPRAPRRAMGPLLGACLAITLGVLVGFGLLAVRNLGEPEEPEFRAMSVTVPVEVSAPRPAPVVAQASAPMEVLAPETPPAVVRLPPVVRKPVAASTPRADPTFSCRRQDTQSERIVCRDAELVRLDRGMNRAFDAAVKAGVPYRSLRQDQDDWLRVREDAAQHQGRDEVAGMYRERIAELKDIAASF